MAADFCHLSLMAEQGNAEAQYCLGVLYQREGLLYKGTTAVPPDMAEALKWLRKSAEQGYAKAQCCLGIMYGTGQGVPQDYVQAYTWFSAAAAGGDKEATFFRNLIAELLEN